MTEKKMEKAGIAVRDIRALACRTRPDCAGSRDCAACPAIVALPDRPGIACIFDLCQQQGARMVESIRKIFCCICRTPMVLTLPGHGEETLWQCNTPGCGIHDYARRKNRALVHGIRKKERAAGETDEMRDRGR